MKKLTWAHLLSYVFVAILAVGSAFFVSLRFVARAHSQTPGASAPIVPLPSTPSAPPAGMPSMPPPNVPAAAQPPTDSQPMPSNPVPPPSTPAPPTSTAQSPAPAPTPAAGTASGTSGDESASAVAAEVQGFLEPFIYESKNRRDPFEPYVEFQPIETQGYLSPLQRYELSEYKLVGIMWDVRQPRAMFVDPEREVHLVGRNDSIGKRNGYIAVIREGEVVVVESMRKGREVVFKPTVLRLER